jgi:hypothetical protein
MWGAVAAAVAVVVAGVTLFVLNLHWFALHTGSTQTLSGPYYNFWSGFGSDIGEATLVATVFVGVYTGLRKVNCHTKGCWRIGHHPLEGTPYHLCRHHHPDVPSGGVTHEQILAAYAKHLEAKAASLLAAAKTRPEGQGAGK